MPSLRYVVVALALAVAGVVALYVMLPRRQGIAKLSIPVAKRNESNHHTSGDEQGVRDGVPSATDQENIGDVIPSPAADQVELPVLLPPARQKELAFRAPRLPHMVPVEWPTISFASPPATSIDPHPERLDYVRMTEDDEASLRVELEAMPEVSLYTSFTESQAKALVAETRRGRTAPETIPPRFVGRTDLSGLPMLKGALCKLHPTAAAELEKNSVAIRNTIRGSVARGRPDTRILSTTLNGRIAELGLTRPSAIPTLQQMLMAEDSSTRELLIRELSRIDGPWASMALAQRAITDLDPRLREMALRELRTRPPEGYLPVFMTGLSYPWVPVARHSAEAIRALKRTEAVPVLLKMLESPGPNAPYRKPRQGTFIREVVKINHHRNCLLCHAISVDKSEPVRGRVPTTDSAFPPTYYQSNEGVFVRADVTYLRQDFSITTEVKNSDPWPSMQRFDFLTRERPVRKGETTSTPGVTTPHEKAVMFALTGLTGKQFSTAEEWRKIYLDRPLSTSKLTGDLLSPKSIAATTDKVIVLDGGAVMQVTGEGKLDHLSAEKDEVPLSRISSDGKNGLLAITFDARCVLRISTDGKRRELVSKGLSSPSRAVSDGAGGAYVVEAAVGTKATGGAVYHVSASGEMRKLHLPLKRPGAIAATSDGGRLYVALTEGHDVYAFHITSPGKVGEGQRIRREGREGNGHIVELAVDDNGHVYILDASSKELEVINSAGAKLGGVKLSAAPVSLSVSGKWAYVLTRTEVLKVKLDITPLVALTRSK